MILTAARVITPTQTLTPGWVRVEGEVIAAVGEGAPPARAGAGRDAAEAEDTPGVGASGEPDSAGGVTDLGEATLIPGYVDMHSHGGGGTAFKDGPEAARTSLAMHRSHGTTAMMASLVTETIDDLEAQVRSLTPLVEDGELIGIHLEGPWMSPLHKGAHPPALLRAPFPDDVTRLIEASRLSDGSPAVKMVTLAVELEHGMEATRIMVDEGVLVALGHSDATYDQAAEALDAGASVATHLYNAMSKLHHREPGMMPALLEREDVTIELIADGVHVHPAMLRHAVDSARGTIVLVTDAMAAAGASDGDYILGTLPVVVKDGIARTETGSLAGSTLTLDRAVRLMVNEVGMPLEDAVRAATLSPADTVGRSDIGRIEPGCRADLTVLDGDLQVTAVYQGGVKVH
ncbi:MAG TPA: N-acetylglucosamine-6-phosphate deacetylase [Actinomycetales bacterium]|nr:N-acetylglucosamine-6-phosphate deacetylase [Actinomycetales bacterium]